VKIYGRGEIVAPDGEEENRREILVSLDSHVSFLT